MIFLTIFFHYEESVFHVGHGFSCLLFVCFLGLPDGSRDDETPREMSMAHARNQSLGRNIAMGLTLT